MKDVAASPTVSLWKQAHRLIAEKQPAQARAVLESFLEKEPRSAEAHLLLSGVLLDLGDLQAATGQLLAALPCLPDDAALISKLARYLFLSGESVAARACFDHPLVSRTRSGADLANLGYVRQMLGEPGPALELMERANAAGIDTADLHYYLGLLSGFNGRKEQAVRHFKTCLAKDPLDGRAMLQWVRTRPASGAQCMDAIRTALRAVKPNTLAHASFEFALYKELDDLGSYDEAWHALRRANDIMRARNPYKPRYEEALLGAIIDRCTAASFAGMAPTRPAGPTPIFIIGLPRSGTTLLERVLGSHSCVHPAGELTDFYRQLRWITNVHGHRPVDLAVLERYADIDFPELGRRYLRQTQWRAQGKAFYVDKLPLNFQLAGLIHRALPHAPILHVYKVPIETCFSNYKAMFNDTWPYSYDLEGLADFHRLYRRLMHHWQSVAPGAVLDVAYDSLVRDPEATARRVFAFCGIPFEAGCLDIARNGRPVSTLSSTQVREPIHARSLGEWKRYAQYLEPLREALGPHAEGGS